MTAISDQILSNTSLATKKVGIGKTREITDQIMNLRIKSNEKADVLMDMATNLSKIIHALYPTTGNGSF